MTKVLEVLVAMLIGSLFYHSVLAEQPNYVETLQMLYWAIVTTVVFWSAGLLRT